jgi:hypothetical protein
MADPPPFMADPLPFSAPDADIGAPRWVKVFGIVVVAAFLLFFIVVGAVHQMTAGGHAAGMPRSDCGSGRAAAGMRCETSEGGR